MSAAASPTPGPGRASAAPGIRSLKRNMLFAVGGMGTFHLCQFGVIVLLAKFAPPDVLGQVQFSLAVATPIVVFCSLELRGALVADAAGEFTFGTYRALRNVMTAVAGAALAGVAVWQMAREPRVAYVVILVGLCAGKLVLALAEIGWGLFQKRERLDLLAASAALRGVTMLASFALFVPLGWHLNRAGQAVPGLEAYGAGLAIVIYVAISVAILVAFDRPRVTAHADYDPRWNWAAVARLARRTFPLGLVLLLLHLCNSIPPLVIERQPDGKAALGFFGALANLTLAGNLLVFQAANAAANRLARFYQTDWPAFGRLAAKLLGLAAAVAALTLAVALPLGEWLLHILYRAEYAAYCDEFRIIVAAQCLALLTNVFGVLVMQMRLFWLQVPAQLTVLICTTAAALMLIPGAENPVRGGAWTMLVRATVHATLYAGCVLAGVLLRPRLLRRAVPLCGEPAGLGAGPDDTLPNC